MVQRLDADLGIAFDGDGDRLGVVTQDGQNIFPDRLLMLFAADVLERNPGALIIYDVKCTGRLPGHILRHGGSPLMWKTGPFADQGEDARDRRRAGRRDERPLLLQGALVRLRRRHLRRRAPAGDPVGCSPIRRRRRCRRVARRRVHAGDQGRCAGRRSAQLRRALPQRGEVRRRAPVDHRWPARGLAGRLGPGARVEHHAGAGACASTPTTRDALERIQARSASSCSRSSRSWCCRSERSARSAPPSRRDESKKPGDDRLFACAERAVEDRQRAAAIGRRRRLRAASARDRSAARCASSASISLRSWRWLTSIVCCRMQFGVLGLDVAAELRPAPACRQFGFARLAQQADQALAQAADAELRSP